MVAPDEPIPLSADDVAALVRGEMPEERIDKLLSAREVRVEAEPHEPHPPQRERLEEVERPEEPMEISNEELKALSTGREVEAVNKRLEELRRDTGGGSGGTIRRE